MRSRPTRDGWIAALLAFALTDVGAIGGNNLIILVACIGWAALIVDAAVGRWNLRGLAVARRLPEEFFAYTGCRGAFLLQNPRTRGAVREVQLTDGMATGQVSTIGAGQEVSVGTWWQFRARGPVELGGIIATSRFPFGFFEHRLHLDGEAHALVYPRPVGGRLHAAGEMRGDSSQRRGPEQTGDFEDLRSYQQGDRLRSIHWRTSARMGRPMVVVRGGEGQEGVVVRVRPDAEVEDELERATGAVLDAAGRGLAVGLLLEGRPELADPDLGTRWRRQLLDALALHRLEQVS